MKKIFHPLKLDSVNAHRKEDCLHYDGCLEEASALLWPSFSCKGCPLYNPQDIKHIHQEGATSPLGWEV